IVRLARHRYLSSDPLLEAAQLITQAACEAYGTARAGIWRLLDHQVAVQQLAAMLLEGFAELQHGQHAVGCVQLVAHLVVRAL
ncbi:hypothetical protein LJG46_32855, partial [Pseudomonas aeruginosa]